MARSNNHGHSERCEGSRRFNSAAVTTIAILRDAQDDKSRQIMKIIPITNAVGEIIELEWLRQSESVFRQLRPHLPTDFVGRMKEVFATGAEMAACVVDGNVRGITVFRVFEKTFSGRELYCDDLVTDETARSTGVGRTMIAYMESIAAQRGCDTLALDSGCQRQQAHKFYFREGLTIPAFRFSKPVKKSAS